MTPILLILAATASAPQGAWYQDTFATKEGALQVVLVGHGSLMFTWKGVTVHVDPWSRVGNYSQLPKADLILITHGHRDHLDPEAISLIRTPATELVVCRSCEGKVEGAKVLANGQSLTAKGVGITAVPAYNLVHRRENGQPYHEKGDGNAYVLTFADLKVLVAGDTENVPELKELKGIHLAFLPMNLPYTMTPEMVADLARALRPKVLVPYHFGTSDLQQLVSLLADLPEVELRLPRKP
ncbi:MAG: MBL fold metallo-hydrolase [Thermoanaerobaculum sp.]|nr:MBL fold metallo-hydrolase [Thermoanaerobaculum sp.]